MSVSCEGAGATRCSHARLRRLGLLDSGRADTAVVIDDARSFVPGDDGVDDRSGHAAACLRALDAALAIRGACLGCLRLVCARVIGAHGERGDTGGVARAVLWLAAWRVDVIAAPLSFTTECPRTRRAVTRYLRGGGQFVAAAGRSSPTLAFPAAWPGVIAVQGDGGPFPKAGVPCEPASDDSRAVMYYAARLITGAAPPYMPPP